MTTYNEEKWPVCHECFVFIMLGGDPCAPQERRKVKYHRFPPVPSRDRKRLPLLCMHSNLLCVLLSVGYSSVGYTKIELVVKTID